jgi:hypothetical protein
MTGNTERADPHPVVEPTGAGGSRLKSPYVLDNISKMSRAGRSGAREV